jgi:hypothetical protein
MTTLPAPSYLDNSEAREGGATGETGPRPWVLLEFSNGAGSAYLPGFTAAIVDQASGTVAADVPVASGLTKFVAAFRLGGSFFVLPAFSVGVNFRLNAPFGDDFPWLLEVLRLGYWPLHGPRHYLGLSVSGGFGKLAHSIGELRYLDEYTGTEGTVDEYYYLAGLGTVGASIEYCYNFVDHFGVGAQFANNFMMPSFSWNFDLLLEVNVVF